MMKDKDYVEMKCAYCPAIVERHRMFSKRKHFKPICFDCRQTMKRGTTRYYNEKLKNAKRNNKKINDNLDNTLSIGGNSDL